MDKRILLYKIDCTLDGTNPITINVYEKKTGNRMIARMSYGELEIYCSRYTSKKSVNEFIAKVIKKRPDNVYGRPFYKEGVYLYLLGKKRYLTDDVGKKDDPFYFYVPKTMKDPLTKYKKLFLEYLKERLVILGKRMNVDLSDWTIRTGLFLSYLGSCFPRIHQMKFDYRLFAYPTYISDSVLIHEIAHIFEINHNARFYSIVKYYCPDYDRLQADINQGYFEGELDHVIPHY